MITRAQVVLLTGIQLGARVTITTPRGWGYPQGLPARVIDRHPVPNGVVYLCESDGFPGFHPPHWVGESYLVLRGEGDNPDPRRPEGGRDG